MVPFCCSLLLSSCAAPSPTSLDSKIAEITASCQAELDAIFAAGSFPGATASLVLEDGNIIRLAVGKTEKGGRSLTPSDRMLVGSVGKTWVASLIHQLVARGNLEYEGKAAEWFREDEWYFRIPNAGEVTIRQLLRHQSGLERYEFKQEFWNELMLDPNRVWHPQELLAFVFDDPPMFPPGEGWAYADTNYIILGMIIERSTGRTFYDLAEEWINRPNLLHDTIPSNSRTLAGTVQGTVVAGRQLGVGPFALSEGAFTYNVQFEWCGGGFASTSTDLARWAWLLFSNRWLGEAGVAALLDAVPAPGLGPGRFYGLGVILTNTRIGQLRGHDGFMPGYLTAMGYFPDSGIAAAIQVNTDDGKALKMPLHEILVRLSERVLFAAAPTSSGVL